MKTYICWIILILFLPNKVLAQNTSISIEEFKSHLKFLSDDKLQGRFPGSQGGDLAAKYIASEFERCGLQPASSEQGYLQPVPIKSVKTEYNSAVFTISGNGFQEKIKPYEEVLLISREEKELVDYSGEMVFVGHGAIAPEYKWDDYKEIDVKGKIVVCLSNHPEFMSPNYKPGNTTYYGHWDYTPKIAFDKGAKGILIIVENDAWFPWHLYQVISLTSYYGQYNFIAPLPFISYISENVFDRALKKMDLTVSELIKKANSIEFLPFALPMNIKTVFSQSFKKFTSPNVIGYVPGTKKTDEAIILMAHYDHDGIGKSENGDSIYNGAIDNASGAAALLTLANYFSEHPAKRSVIFLATTAEEIGFWGSEYYLKNPVIPLKNTIIGINIDMMNFLGKRDSIELSPVVYTDAVETVRKIGKKMNLDLKLSDYDSEFKNYRLDSYPFAMYDVVTFNIFNLNVKGNYPSMSKNEIDEIIKNGGFGYHTPFDEIKPWFRYDGILQEMEIAKEVGLYYANDGIKPKFNKENPFAPAKALWLNK